MSDGFSLDRQSLEELQAALWTLQNDVGQVSAAVQDITYMPRDTYAGKAVAAIPPRVDDLPGEGQVELFQWDSRDSKLKTTGRVETVLNLTESEIAQDAVGPVWRDQFGRFLVTAAAGVRNAFAVTLEELPAGTPVEPGIRTCEIYKWDGAYVPTGELIEVANYWPLPIAAGQRILAHEDTAGQWWCDPQPTEPVEVFTVTGMTVLTPGDGNPIVGGLVGTGTFPALANYDPITGIMTLLKSGLYRVDVEAETGSLATTPPPSKSQGFRMGAILQSNGLDIDVLFKHLHLTDTGITYEIRNSGHMHRSFLAGTQLGLVQSFSGFPSGTTGSGSYNIAEWSITRIQA